MASLALGVKFNATSTGTGDFVDASVITGYVRAVGTLINGKLYRYRAENASLTEWEWGLGAWNSATSTLARTTMTLTSTGSKVSFTSVPVVSIVPFPDDILQFDDAMSLTSAQQDRGRANIGIPGRNLLINGDFRINQRAYVSAAGLAAGVYGHDRWKAGAGGGDYTFTQLKASTQITIAASKTLIQVVEDVKVVGGNYVLSWSGTSQARVGINTSTPAGGYAASPILITGQTAGTTMSVEFNVGTLGQVQLEVGTVASPFEMRPYDQEMDACYRYAVQYTSVFAGIPPNSQNLYPPFNFPKPMRAAPTLTGASFTATGGPAGTVGYQTTTIYSTNLYNVSNNWTGGVIIQLTGLFSAEL